MRYESTADALVDAGRDADLLVMGAGGEATRSGVTLGSKAGALLRSAVCPVEIVPTRRPDSADLPRQAGSREVSGRVDTSP